MRRWVFPLALLFGLLTLTGAAMAVSDPALVAHKAMEQFAAFQGGG